MLGQKLGCGDEQIGESEDKNYSKSCWQVAEDSTITCSNTNVRREGDFPFEGFEIVSPVLNMAPHKESASSVARVLELMQKFKPQASPNAALHVHMDASHLSTQALKVLVLLYSHYEQAIQLLVSCDRRGSNHHWFLPLPFGTDKGRMQEFENLGYVDRRGPHLSDTEAWARWQQQILACQTEVELIDLVNPGVFGDINELTKLSRMPGKSQGYALSLVNLDSRIQKLFHKPKTLEFRLPRSTTDPEEGLFWMVFVQLLAREAERTAQAGVAGIMIPRLNTDGIGGPLRGGEISVAHVGELIVRLTGEKDSDLEKYARKLVDDKRGTCG
jgi:hypothetical protein